MARARRRNQMYDETMSASRTIKSIIRATFAFACFIGLSAAFAAEPETVAPDDLAALKAHLGQVVEIKATVTGVGQSPTGNVLFVNFVKKAHAGVTAVYFTSGGRAGNVKSLDELKPFVGKTVTIKGELTAYKDDVQMVLQSVEDLHAVDK